MEPCHDRQAVGRNLQGQASRPDGTSGYFAAYIKGAAKRFDEIEDSQTATILNIAVERTSSMNEAIAIKARRSLS